MTNGRRPPAGPKPLAPARPLKEGFAGTEEDWFYRKGRGRLWKR